MTSQSLPEPLLAFEPATEAVKEVLARIDALSAEWRRARDSGQILPQTQEALRIELTYHSNAIEGNTLSLRETQLVNEGHSPSSGKSMRELYEARNHDRAIRQIEGWVSQDREQVTEQDVLNTHAAVVADIDPYAGCYRTHRVLIAGTGFVPPGNQKFGELMPRVLELANRRGVHPALQAAEFHYNLVAVHPFADGNGRTARLMMNYLLLRQSFPLTVVELTRREAYLTSLDEANGGRWEPFAVFTLECIERSLHRMLGE